MFIDKKTLLVGAVIIFVALIGGVYGYLAKSGKPVESISILNQQPEKSKEIKIYIVGEVENPGTYAFSEGARIEDAIIAAGGTLETADIASLNLATYLKDEQKITVPSKNNVNYSSNEQGSKSDFININTANAAELDKLPNIGPVTAENIISYRETAGGFNDIKDIMKVSGIGQKTFDAIKDFITVQ